ncbi:universal stress protein [Streptosporangium sp. G11]|uniref:universal stress protein n=1 Tax=Streptosporangium sp. G11 TaxID=3436926 RepID=UPI003EBD2A8C
MGGAGVRGAASGVDRLPCPRAEREAAITEQRRRHAGRVLFEGVQLAERLLPGREVRSILVRGAPGPELVSLSRTAKILVVGSRGLGGLTGLLLGSVSVHVAAHAFCPVLVIPPHATPQVSHIAAARRIPGSSPNVTPDIRARCGVK